MNSIHMHWLFIVIVLTNFTRVVSNLRKSALIKTNFYESFRQAHPICHLDTFSENNGQPNGSFELLEKDVNKFCSTINPMRNYRILCRVVVLILEYACSTADIQRRIPSTYSLDSRNLSCSSKRILSSSSWILDKLNFNRSNQIDLRVEQLCPILNSVVEMRPLVRFLFQSVSNLKRSTTVEPNSEGNSSHLNGNEQQEIIQTS